MSAIPIENLFAKKLASNEAKIRDQAVKKLSAWLKSRADTPLMEEEMMRLWKGLFYCYWMSDKMLIQEELAEKISAMIQIFGGFQETSILFIRCGFKTLGREWSGIDQLRMNKFMMFVRRFLRQVFILCASKNWNDLNDLTQMFEKDIVCANKSIKDKNSCLGFILHFIDVFLEELAKVGGEDLPDEVIRVFLTPFINQICYGFDQRLLDHIKVRIFQHLMRQSDIGIAFENEEFLDDEDDMEDDEEEDMELEENGVEVDDNSEKEDLKILAEAAKDPRAGKVDVIIPQLMVDYAKLSKQLFEAGGDKKVMKSGRKMLYELSKQFQDLSAGKYPLAPDYSGIEEVKSIKWKKEIKRHLAEDIKEYENVKNAKLEYKKALKAKSSKNPVQLEIQANTENSDSGINDSCTSSDESRNAQEEVKSNKGTTKQKGMKRQSANDNAQLSKRARKEKNLEEIKAKPLVEDDVSTNDRANKKDKDLKSNNNKKKAKTSGELNDGIKEKAQNSAKCEAKEVGDDEKTPMPLKKKKLKEKKIGALENNKKANVSVNSMDKKKKKAKISGKVDDNITKKAHKTTNGDNKKVGDDDKFPSMGISGFAAPTIKAKPGESPKAMFFKKSASKSTQSSPVSPKKKPKKVIPASEPRKSKQINFAMTCNRYQSVKDHSNSISESPEIPFTPNRKPRKGVLKNKKDISIVGTPVPLGQKLVLKNTKINGISTKGDLLQTRMLASDFF